MSERQYWRMAMRIGDRGANLFPVCRNKGIAAIGYWATDGEQVVGDCAGLSEDEFKKQFSARHLSPNPGTARKSLFNLVFEMKPGDIIYVKDGPKITGKGTITRGYEYDENIMKGEEIEFPHYVSVDWEKDFPEIPIQIEPKRQTILLLDGERLESLFQAEAAAKKITIGQLRHEMQSSQNLAPLSVEEIGLIATEEGQEYLREALFRARNKAIIQQKKDHSDHHCEVCGMRYLDVYGIGEGYIVAHHLNPIGSRAGSSPTTLDDIALVCANCHAMLHEHKPLPYAPDELRRLMKRKET